MIPVFTSISWNIKENIILIYTDSGRLCRPVFYVENMKISYEINNLTEKLLNDDFQFSELLIGFNKFNTSQITNANNFIKNNKVFNKCSELYQEKSFEELTKNCGIIYYLDTAESETILIANFR